MRRAAFVLLAVMVVVPLAACTSQPTPVTAISKLSQAFGSSETDATAVADSQLDLVDETDEHSAQRMLDSLHSLSKKKNADLRQTACAALGDITSNSQKGHLLEVLQSMKEPSNHAKSLNKALFQWLAGKTPYTRLGKELTSYQASECAAAAPSPAP